MSSKPKTRESDWKLQAALNEHIERYKHLITSGSNDAELADVSKWLGDCYFNHRRLSDAEHFYKKSLWASQKAQEMQREIDVLYRLMDCYSEQRRNDQWLLLERLIVDLECDMVLRDYAPRNNCSLKAS